MNYMIIAVRGAFAIETRFVETSRAGSVKVEVIIMNEQGTDYFDTCCDSKGTFLTGNEIGSWRETISDEVSFIDSHNNIAFTLSRVGESRMFFGRERSNFAYDIRIGAGK